MGILERCKLCELPVLELEGQFESLTPYVDNPDEDREAFALVGEIHTKCLVESVHGKRWTEWRLKHFRGRGYDVVGVVEGWTVLATPRTRDRYALHESGASVGLEPGTKLKQPRDGFARAPTIKNETHISLGDRAFVADIQARLAKDKQVPLAELIDHLEIRERLYWAGVLDNARWVFSRRLRRDWSPTNVSAEIHYDIGVPQAVADLWNATVPAKA
jgi:hypothetical protein